ncbi:hypothetical protein EJMOOK_03920 [Rhodanobacter sp. Root179]
MTASNARQPRSASFSRGIDCPLLVGLLSRPLLPALVHQSKSFRLPAAAEPPFSEWPEKRGPKRGHPASALSGRPARKVREPGPGFSNGHPVRAKRSRHPCRLPLRGLSTPPRRCRGAPGRAAGHRGPHFSEEPDQEQSCGNPELCSGFLLLLFSFITECALGARRFTRGPYGAAGGRRKGPAGVAGRDAGQFDVSPWMDCRRTPGARPRTWRAGCPEGAPSGWPFSWVTFSLATQRESDSVAEGDRPLCT